MKLSEIAKSRKLIIWVAAGLLAMLAIIWAVLFFASRRQVAINQQASVTLSEPETVAPLAPIGDSFADSTSRAVIYYLDSAGENLVATVRDVRQTSGTTLAEALLETLLDTPAESNITAPAPSDVSLISVEQSSGTATVNLSIEARRLDPEQMYKLRAAIVNTLTELPTIRNVNVLVDGREEGIIQLPTGTMSRMSSDMQMLWSRAEAENERYNGATVQPDVLARDATLYYGANVGHYLLPEVCTLRIEQNDSLGSIMNALVRGSSQGGARLLPEGSEYMRLEPALITAEDGTKLASISFTSAIRDYFAQHGISTESAFGSIVLSVCTFVPEVEGVVIDIDGALVTEVTNAAGEMAVAFPDNVMRRADFEYLVGEKCRVYFPTDDSKTLLPVDIAISRHDAQSPRARLMLLMRQLVNPYSNYTLVQPMPADARDADLLGVHIENGQVLLNFSGEFYRACRQLTQAQERALVYSIVNTMCELDNVNQVRFYFDGERVDTLSGGIYLRGPIMCNVGMVRAS